MSHERPDLAAVRARARRREVTRPASARIAAKAASLVIEPRHLTRQWRWTRARVARRRAEAQSAPAEKAAAPLEPASGCVAHLCREAAGRSERARSAASSHARC